MRAIVQDEYGSSDVLRLEDVETPVAGRGEVLIRVIAASAFIGDWHVITGTPYAIRLVSGLGKPKQRVRGQDVAGKIEAIGEEVTAFRPGDEVFGVGNGTFAEYATAGSTSARRSRRTSASRRRRRCRPPVHGAPGIHDVGKVQSGHSVLVVGAAGGIGSCACRSPGLGRDVTGVCSTSKVELVRSIERDEVIDYTHEDIVDGTRRYDLIFDTAGNRASLPPPARHDPRRGPSSSPVAKEPDGGSGWVDVVRAKTMSLFVGQRMTNFLSRPKAEDLIALKELIEADKIDPMIGTRYSLGEVPAAIADRSWTRSRKVVITV